MNSRNTSMSMKMEVLKKLSEQDFQVKVLINDWVDEVIEVVG